LFFLGFSDRGTLKEYSIKGFVPDPYVSHSVCPNLDLDAHSCRLLDPDLDLDAFPVRLILLQSSICESTYRKGHLQKISQI
jgi:hypothetical protein